MRKLGSYLVILIFLTAYGRCVADQLGILYTSGASCCQTVCEEAIDSCDHCPETGEASTSHTGNGDHTGTGNDQQDPLPCQLCFILDSDSMLTGDSVKAPSPNIRELNDFHGSDVAAGKITRLLNHPCYQDMNAPGQPDPPTEPGSRLLRIGTRITPVRGPSVA